MLFFVVPAHAGEHMAMAAPPTAGGKKGAAVSPPAAAGGVSPGPAPLFGERTFPVEAVQELLVRIKALRHRLESPRLPTDLFGEDAPSPDELARLRASVERALSPRAPHPRVPGGVSGGGSASDDELCGGSSSRQRLQAKDAAGGTTAGGEPPTDLQFLIKLEGMLSLQSGLNVVDAGFSAWLGGLFASV
jgi:hypothetical protein